VSGHSDDRHVVTRREFTVESALALLAGVTITISGCGDDDNSSPTPTSPSPAPVNVTGSVSTNHGHEATVTGAQISSGGTISLDIRGTASHPHTVQLSPGQLGAIGARQQVVATSTIDNNHSHAVTFN
jgi:hypothetical protein